MKKYIEHKALPQKKERGFFLEDDFNAGWNACLDNIESIPAADVVAVRHGRWIWDPDGMDWGLGAWRCSKCKSKAETWWTNDKKYNPLCCSGGHFCGNCGARMDGDVWRIS